MTYAPRRPGFEPRLPVRDPKQIRQDWVAALDLATSLTAAAMRGGEGDAPQAVGGVARLMTVLRTLSGDSFPVEAWSARQQAGAFVHLAKAWVNPAMGPEARTTCAPFLAAGAAVLDGLLTRLRTEEAQRSWRNQTGERD